MNYNEAMTAIDNRSLVRITENNGTHKGTHGLALGYRDAYHSVKVGFLNEDGTYSGDYTMVYFGNLELVVDAEEAAAPETQVAPANTWEAMETGLDNLLAETEAAIPAPIVDRDGVTWTWKTGNVFRDGTGRAWPREFIPLPERTA